MPKQRPINNEHHPAPPRGGEGLEPVWISEAIPGGGSGGWGSPAIAEDRVYVFVPTRTKRDDVQLPPRQFPPLAVEEREAMSEQFRLAYHAVIDREGRLAQTEDMRRLLEIDQDHHVRSSCSWCSLW